MSANIPETMLVSDLLKSTGYNCPDNLKDTAFYEATSGGSSVELENNKTVSITENGTIEITPSEGKDAMKKVTATVNVPSSSSAPTFSIKIYSGNDIVPQGITIVFADTYWASDPADVEVKTVVGDGVKTFDELADAASMPIAGISRKTWICVNDTYCILNFMDS